MLAFDVVVVMIVLVLMPLMLVSPELVVLGGVLWVLPEDVEDMMLDEVLDDDGVMLELLMDDPLTFCCGFKMFCLKCLKLYDVRKSKIYQKMLHVSYMTNWIQFTLLFV